MLDAARADRRLARNIVDLGLIYDCKIEPIVGGKDSYRVDVKMTLTAPGCGMGPVLQQDVQSKLLNLELICSQLDTIAREITAMANLVRPNKVKTV